MIEKKSTPNEYISLAEASKLCNYSQEYLSLRARQGKLKAVKLGRNWVTTQEWLNEYIKSNQYISLQDAAKSCSYSQEYLSLRARQKKLRAIKLDGRWVTTQKWLDEYLRQVKGEEDKHISKERVIKKRRLTRERILKKFIGRPLIYGLVFGYGLVRWLALFIRQIKNITFWAAQKFLRPLALSAILIILLIIGSILLVSPQARNSLVYLPDILSHTLSDTMPDTLGKLSDTGKNTGQRLIISIQQPALAIQTLGKEVASFKGAVAYLSQQISQNQLTISQIWDKFSKFVPQIPQKTILAFQKTKSKLGDAYLKVVQFFEGFFGDRTPLVHGPGEGPLEEGIGELEENIIEDIQVRFDDFRGDWGITEEKEKEEGVIVVPLEEDEEETQRKLKELSGAFSDEVEVEPDETGKAGLIQPIFRQDRLQKYLYMMVPVKEKKEPTES